MSRHTSGYVALHRKILNSWIGRDAISFAIFMLLILWANRKRGKEPLRGELRTLERGQLATSSEEIAAALDLNRKTVERRLKMLEEDSAIVQQASRRGRILTIVNYDKYQRGGLDVVAQESHRSPIEGATARSPSGEGEKIDNGTHRQGRESEFSDEAALAAAGRLVNALKTGFDSLSKDDAAALRRGYGDSANFTERMRRIFNDQRVIMPEALATKQVAKQIAATRHLPDPITLAPVRPQRECEDWTPRGDAI